MKLKLTNNEIISLINSMKMVNGITFNTQLEKKICTYMFSEFTVVLMKKAMCFNKKYTVTIDGKTLLVLNHVLPQIYPTNDYDLSVMTRVIKEINQACLNLL